MNVRACIASVLVYAALAATPVLAEERGTMRKALWDEKAEKGRSVSIRNDHGPITVTGWDGAEVSARALGRGDAEVPVRVVVDPTSNLVTVSPTPDGRYGRLRLLVQVPRGIPVTVAAAGDEVDVTDVRGEVRARSGSGNVRVSKAGRVKAGSGSGNVTVETATGDTVVEASSGNVVVSNVGGSLVVEASSGNVDVDKVESDLYVNALSGNVDVVDAKGNAKISALSGNTTLQRVAGRVEINSASGSIYMTEIGGEVDAQTASGDVRFAGTLLDGGRYKLKTTSGNVEMRIQADPPGFTATLASYSGEIETEFPITIQPPLKGSANRRLTGKYKEGTASLELVTFSGTAVLGKLQPKALKKER